MKKISYILVSLFMVLTFQGCYFEVVDSGEAGVEVARGQVNDTYIGSGFQYNLSYFAELDKYNVKARQLELSDKKEAIHDTNKIIRDSAVKVYMNGNMEVPLDVTLLYKLKDDCAPHIRKEFGQDIIWDNMMVVPVVKDVIMSTIGKDVDIYLLNKNRDEYGNTIKKDAQKKINQGLGKDCVTVEMVSIRDIKIPQQITDSIMKKNQMEEEARRAELEVKKAEAEAKVAEAKALGTANAQLTLAKSITPEMIRWKELEIQEKAVEKWDGKMPTSLVNGGANSNMDFLYQLPPIQTSSK